MIIDRKELYQKYIIENLSRKECAIYFKCSEALIKKRLHAFNIIKPYSLINNVKVRSSLKKYGKTHPMKEEAIAKKVSDTKRNWSEDKKQEVCNKYQTTMQNKYGVNNAAQLNTNYFKSVKDEERETLLDRSHKALRKIDFTDVVSKTRATCLKKYGVSSYTQTKEYRVLMDERAQKRRDTLFKTFSEAKLNAPLMYWKDLITSQFGVVMDVYEGDVLYSYDYKISIAINTVRNRKSEGKYHRRRAIQAEQQGWLLYQIYDWDDEEKVLRQLKSLFGQNERVYARKCVVAKIDKKESATFLNKYHLQGSVGSTWQYGLYYNNDLVAVMTFGKARFHKEAEVELLRFCSNGTIIGGASKLFKYAIKDMGCNSIVTFSDMSKGHGKLYQTLGFEFMGYAALNGLYAPEYPTGEALRTQAASLEFKKHGEGYKTCKEYFNAKRWYRINDAGSKLWLWKSGYNSGN